MSRTMSSLKNMIFAFVGQLAGTLSVFIARIVFLKILSSDYLGISGLFTNLLTVLSFAELGFGTAITYSLYKPLSENNVEKIKSLMSLFKKIYIVVGTVIIVAGLAISPFLSFFIDEMPDIPNLTFIFILYVINTAVSYFYSYKKTLIIADQNRYIASFYRYLFYVLVNVAQIIVLIITRNYIMYMFVQILFTLMENIAVSKKADKMYPYLKDKNIKALSKSEKHGIFSNTKAMMMHKVGSIVVTSTDNIILSKFVGLNSVALYTNYLTIRQALLSLTGQIFNSLSAGIGNLCVEDKKEKQINVFKDINFATFIIYSITSICLLNLLSPFIKLWVGEEYVFNNYITIIFVLNYYITGMRNSVLTYRESMGLFYKDRYKAIIEAISNLIISIVLAKKIGTLGVLIGTFVSSVCVSVWIEVLVLFKYGFKTSVKGYYKDYFSYFVFTIIFSIVTVFLCSLFTIKNLFIKIIINGIISVIIPIIGILIIYSRKNEFSDLIKIVSKLKIFKSVASKLIRNKNI